MLSDVVTPAGRGGLSLLSQRSITVVSKRPIPSRCGTSGSTPFRSSDESGDFWIAPLARPDPDGIDWSQCPDVETVPDWVEVLPLAERYGRALSSALLADCCFSTGNI